MPEVSIRLVKKSDNQAPVAIPCAFARNQAARPTGSRVENVSLPTSGSWGTSGPQGSLRAPDSFSTLEDE